MVLDGGKIVWVGPNEAVRLSGTAQAVDATGKFVVPGFVDMHIHAMVRSTQTPSYFPLMLANGITGFREMGEFQGSFPNMVARAAQLNADIAAGLVDVPEALLVPGEIFPASPSPAAPPISTASATAGVIAQKTQGVGFIKVILATRDAMLAYLSESNTQGLPLAGHLTPAVSATESSQLGWKSIEHLGSGIGILLDCATDENSIRQSIITGAGAGTPRFPSDTTTLQRLLDTYSVGRCQNLAKVFVQNGTWHVPTLRRVRGLDRTDDPLMVNDPNLVYVDSVRRGVWNTAGMTYANLPAANRTALGQIYDLKKSVVKLLKDNGVKMMAGSDGGQASTWVVPGFGLHEDFRELTDAGLSPLDILQMTTLNPAEFLNRQATMGTVEAGRNADLVLLEADPIKSAANLDKIAGVFLKGRYLPKTRLDHMKNDVAKAYANLPAPALAAIAAAMATEPEHTD